MARPAGDEPAASAEPDGAAEAASPVRRVAGDSPGTPEDGVALCLSGGGFRAMLFHLGVLWRLNDARMLGTLDRVSSVSGGSITAAVLGLHWENLAFDETGFARDFATEVVPAIRELAGVTVDARSIFKAAALPAVKTADLVAKAYRDHLFRNATLQDLPDRPRFVINATNLESTVLMRFSKPYIADYRVGRIMAPDVPLSLAVAASSAFPPVLSPCTIDLSTRSWVTDEGNDLSAAAYRGKVRLTDGGVYDNLGLETAWKRCRTVIVSDGGGGPLAPQKKPPSDWLRQMVRVLLIMDNQVRSLRIRQTIAAFEAGRPGVYVGIRSRPTDYHVDDPMSLDPALAERLAATPTRLRALSAQVQEQLVNLGYVVCDAGLRSRLDKSAEVGQLPYPDRPMTADPG